jgi:hypothetical protein
MWIDGRGLTHYGRTSFEERKLDELRASMTIEEKYKEKVEEACRWLDIILYSDPNTIGIRVHPLAYKSQKEVINDFCARLTIEEKYKENVEEACRWLNDILYSDPNNLRNIRVHPLAYNSKKEIIDNFRNKLKLSIK